jgi:hypothetical protein
MIKHDRPTPPPAFTEADQSDLRDAAAALMRIAKRHRVAVHISPHVSAANPRHDHFSTAVFVAVGDTYGGSLARPFREAADITKEHIAEMEHDAFIDACNRGDAS